MNTSALARRAVEIGASVLLVAPIALAAAGQAPGALDFESQGSVAVGRDRPDDMRLADFDRDGYLDLIAGTGGADHLLMLFFGNGDGTFGPLNELTILNGYIPIYVDVDDVNGDTYLDLVTANWPNGNGWPHPIDPDVSILLGDGFGGFVSNAEHNYQVGTGSSSNPQSSEVGDLDGDGFGDIVSAHWSGASVTVMHGLGDGTFTYNSAVDQYSIPDSSCTHAALGDMNGDGDLDVVVSGNYSTSIYVMLGNGDGTLGVPVQYSTIDRTSRTALGDIDHDNDLDVVAIGFNPAVAQMAVLLNNGDGTLAPKVLYPVGDSSEDVDLVDIDADGHLDAITSNNNVGFSVLLGLGDGTFQSPQLFGTGRATSLDVADLDGDGLLDVVFTDALGDNYEVFLQKSSEIIATNFAYVSDILGNTVTVIDTDTNTVAGTIDGFVGPRMSDFLPDGTRAYVPNQLGSTITVIDTATHTVVEDIPVSYGPHTVRISPAGTRAYAANASSNIFTVIDTATSTVIATVPTYQGAAIALTLDGTKAYVGQSDKSLAVIDLTSHSVVGNVPLADIPENLALTPDGATVWVPMRAAQAISLVDTATDTVTVTLPLSGWPVGVDIHGDRAYVSTRDSAGVSVFDTNTLAVVGSVAVGNLPHEVALTPDGGTLYVANHLDNTVSVVDTATLTVITTVPVGIGPAAVVVKPGASVNAPPVANGGPDLAVDEAELAQLDGSGSYDPDGDPIVDWFWTQIAGAAVTLDELDPARPTFTAPYVPFGGETLTFELVVGDGELLSGSAFANVNVKNVNNPPVADAGPDQAVQEGAPVTLDGGGSYDEDGESLTYAWTQVQGTTVALSDPAAPQPAFTAPFVGIGGETLTFELVVNDGQDDSLVDSVDVFVENVNHPPVADAGDPQTVAEGTTVWLDGSASVDPDQDPLDFLWSQLSGPYVTLNGAQAATPWFTAPTSMGPSVELVFELRACDPFDCDTATVTVTVLSSNAPPDCSLARASVASLWPPNHKMVPISVLGVSDPNDDTVTITITAVTQDEPVDGTGSGDTAPDAVLQGDTVLIRAERAGGGNGRVYVVSFQADDGLGGVCSGSVTVWVPHDKRSSSCPDDGQFYDSTQL